MTKDEVCALISEIGIIPAIRVSSGDDAHFAAEAVDERRNSDRGNHHDRAGSGGADLPPGPAPPQHRGGRRHGSAISRSARQCLDAGASFMTAPGFDPEIVEFAAKENLAVLPGALTPTEVVTHGRPERIS